MRDSSWDAIFGQSFGGEAPFYMYGHRLEINNRLKEKDADMVFKYKKYPLIALRMDIPEGVRNGKFDYSLNIAILTFTEQQWNAEERMAQTFKPKLYLLYARFMEELRKSGLFQWKTEMGEYPPHVKIDRPFWGQGYSYGKPPSNEGNKAFLFDDPLDAIEIVNLEISALKKC